MRNVTEPPLELPLEPIISGWEATLRRRQERRLHILQTDCPRCPQPLGERARSCAIAYGDDCRHAAWKQSHEATQERIARFRRHRLGRPEWEALVTESHRPPAPPTSWLRDPADVQAHMEARRMVALFAEGRGPQVLVLSGRTGAGKSLLAAWAACRYESALLVAATRANAYASWDPVLEGIDGVRLALLDDVGLERPSENQFASRNVATLLCERINAGQRLIVTTNLLLATLIEKYDALTDGRLRGRLLESAEFVSLGGTDLRLEKSRHPA